MKIGEQIRELTVVGDTGETKRATISADKMAKLQYLLTKGLYRDPITAVIAEWTNNGIDSVVQAGKNPIDNPVIVSIGLNTRGQAIFSVEDKGIGLSDSDFENICMNYLESTKEDNNDVIGHFGIGMKSFLSLERSATFTCRKDGVERVYLVYEGEEFVNYDLIKEEPTNEENGVKAELVINGYPEKQLFESKARQKLAYYDTAVLVIDGVVQQWNIFRNELFQHSSANMNSSMHICLKDVYYPIDWEALGINPLLYSIALRFDLDSGIIPTPSRESYITNEKTKNLILDRISDVAEWMVKKYNDTVREFSTFREAYPYLGNNNPCLSFPLNEGNLVHYYINKIADYAKTPILTPKVKGIKLADPIMYRNRVEDLFYEFLTVGHTDAYNKFRSKVSYVTIRGHFLSGYNPIIVKDGLKGNLRDYLKEKYGKNSLFVRANPEKRKLYSSKEKNDFISYYHILSLHLKPKRDWRLYIKEWEFVRDQVFSNFVDERNAEDTQEYLDWVEKKKKEARSKRKTTSYKAINKQDGEVTLSYLTEHSKIRGEGFKKAAYPIKSLLKNHFLTVLIDDNSDEEKGMARRINMFMKNNNVRFAVVGKKERKKIPEFYQFTNLDKFMTIGSKPFMRLASALLFDKTIRDFDYMTRSRENIIKNCVSHLDKDREVLGEYVDKNIKRFPDHNVVDYIIEVAKEHNLFDKEMWDCYMRLKDGLKKYEFVTCLREPSSWSSDELAKYKTVINQMLLFRKLYHKDLPEEVSNQLTD